jgi:hypothetical protein
MRRRRRRRRRRREDIHHREITAKARQRYRNQFTIFFLVPHIPLA